MPEKKSVAIIDSCPIFTEGLCCVLSKAGFDVVVRARSPAEVDDQHFTTEMNLVLASPPSGDFQTCACEVQKIRDRLPGAKIVLVVDSLNDTDTLAAWPLIDGLVLRTIEREALVKALEIILLGERVVPGVSRRPAAPLYLPLMHGVGAPSEGPHLSPREVDVLRSLSAGSSNKMIARHIGVSEATVKVHMKQILRKLRASNRTEAAVWARNHGIAMEHQAGKAP